MTPRRYDSARDRILEAAVRVITRDGVGRLSVDSVAAAAGISKGGFFYHFKTKASLLAAVVEQLHGEVERTASGDRLRDYVERRVMTDGADADRMSALLRLRLLAADDNPEILKGADSRTHADQTAAALVARLAIDGLWLNQAMGTLSLDSDQRAAVRDVLVSLVDSE